MVVNNSPDMTKNVALVLTFKGKAIYAVDGKEDMQVGSYPNGDGISTQTYIMPGQAVFYRIEE